MIGPRRSRSIAGIGAGLAALLVAASAFEPSPHWGPGAAAPQSLGAESGPSGGRTATLLPDGQWMLIGGEGSEGAIRLWNPATATETFVGALQTPRAWHSATLLPDGTILVAGGMTPDGIILDTAERVDPSSGLARAVSRPLVTTRAGHTGTLLTDGRVLIAGGLSAAGTVLSESEFWDPELEDALPVAGLLQYGRRNHRATLLGDGRVRIEGGLDHEGRWLTQPEWFEPQYEIFLTSEAPEPGLDGPQVTATLPADGSTHVPVDARLALRLSTPADVLTIHEGSITLNGPDGLVRLVRVPAEEGRLVFLTPATPLAPATTYTLAIAGVTDLGGQRFRDTAIVFTTAAPEAEPAEVTEAEEEEWIPDAGSAEQGWQTGRAPSPWQRLPALQASPGVTALAGQVLRLNGRPLADVVVRLGAVGTRTDRTGRFLLAGVPAGPGELVVDGRPASAPGRTYGLFMIAVDVPRATTTALPFTIWTPVLDTAHAIPLSSPTTGPVVARTPRIPGLEVQIPAGAALRDADGMPVTSMTITPIPIDRPPFPLPTGVRFPVYFTLQPGGARLDEGAAFTRGIRLVFPNAGRAPAGSRIDFWSYDSRGLGWFTYGQGTVSADGTQVLPDPGVVIRHFTCASLGDPTTAPGMPPPPGGNSSGGDPVDLATGLFVYERTDLYLPDAIPVALTRTYRPNDPLTRAFGIGATHPYELFIVGDRVSYAYAELILPDGGRIRYDRISPGTDAQSAVMEHTATPTRFYKSRLAWNSSWNGWELTFKDGAAYEFFVDWGPEVVVLRAIRDRFGNRLSILRDSARRITWLVSPSGRTVSFVYDAGNRVTEARDHAGRVVRYTYDASGRLAAVTDPAGGTTAYTYDASHRMLTIEDARGIVYLTNEYDANGRVSRQTQADATTFQFTYTLDVNGKVTQTDETSPRGHVRRVTFNASGYALSETDAVGAAPQQTRSWERQAGSHLITAQIDPLGRRTEYTYDAAGNLTGVTRLAGTADAVTTTLAYEPTFQQVASVTDRLGHTTSFTYTSAGCLATATDPLGQASTFTCDAAGRPVSAADALGQTTQFGYSDGDLTAITDPLGRVTSRLFDGAGRLIRVTDPAGRSTRYEHDPLNRVTRVTDALGGETRFTYDANGNLLTLTDARNNVTTYIYDVMDRVATRTDPLLRQETYQYDANGNLQQVTDRKAQGITYTYDALDRLTQVAYADTSTTTYTYDAGDRLTEIADSVAGTITRTYDPLDRLLSEVTPEGAVSYTYDAADRRTAMTVAGQPAVSYTWARTGLPPALTSAGVSAVVTSGDFHHVTRMAAAVPLRDKWPGVRPMPLGDTIDRSSPFTAPIFRASGPGPVFASHPRLLPVGAALPTGRCRGDAGEGRMSGRC